jgi:phosphoglycerate dehydrogenase-like enzyme
MHPQKPKALFILNPDALDNIYGPDERAEIAELVDVLAPPQTADAIRENQQLLAEVEVIFSGWGAPNMDDAFLAAAPKLRVVFYGAGSIKGFVSEQFWRRGIQVTSARWANAVCVSEYTLAALLFGLKGGWYFSANARQHRRMPRKTPVPGCYHSRVGLVSLGAVGRRVRERLRSFDLRVAVFDPHVDAKTAADLDVELMSLEQLFLECDAVSLHAPSIPATRGMITGAHILSMKPGATLVNTSRGNVVRQDELIAAARQRPDLQFVLDVTDPEPTPPGSPLFDLPNVVLTPHIAGAMDAECRRLGRLMIAELKRYLAAQPLQWGITRETLQRLA